MFRVFKWVEGAVRKGLLLESLDRITLNLSLWMEKSGAKNHRGKKNPLEYESVVVSLNLNSSRLYYS